MSLINIFKVERNKVEDLQAYLSNVGTSYEKSCTIGDVTIPTVLYVKNEAIRNPVKWNWVLDEFAADIIQKEKQAWSVILITIDTVAYVLTFGNAFYYIDKFYNYIGNRHNRLVCLFQKISLQTKDRYHLLHQ